MKVSIITATYNSEETLEDTMYSIHNQSYNDIEHIVIDGLSKDNTLDIVRKFNSSKIVSEKDNGIYDAMNKGILNASGDIVGILNSDDVYYDNNVINQVVNVFKDKKCDAVFSDLFYVKRNNLDKKIRFWKTGKFKQTSFLEGWHPPHPTLFLNREIYNKYGVFNLNYKLAADFELMLRLFENKKIHVEYLEKPTVKMRIGGASNKSFINIFKQNIEIINAFKLNNIRINPLIYILKRVFIKLKQFKNVYK
jgi:glycosyltransferase involved in cell wall biosynthesis